MTLSNTKLMKSAYARYLNSNLFNLWQCYDKYSQAKANAMDYCMRLMCELNGHDLRIVSYNCNVFTVGFLFMNEDDEKCFAYITRDYDRYMKL